MTDAALDIFAPLGDGPAEPLHTGTTTAAPPPDWQPETPAPEEPPAAPRHPKHGVPAAMWVYRDAAGRPLFAVCRFDLPDGGGKEVLPLTHGTLRGRRGWHWKGPAKPIPLYGLPDLAARPDAPVVVEGEKAADAAAALFPTCAAVTWQGGAGAVRLADWSPLAGRAVAVWPDNDAAGRAAAADVRAALAAAGAASVAVVDVPPEWPDGWDVADPPPEGVTRRDAGADAGRPRQRMLAEAAEPGAAASETAGGGATAKWFIRQVVGV